VLPKIEVLPVGLGFVFALVVFPPKSEVPGAVDVFVLVEGVPKIDVVPVGFVFVELPKSEVVPGWFEVFVPPG
jgi:hypothetical protein